MRHLTTAFAPFIVCLVIGLTGIFNDFLLVGAPAILCGTPLTMFWAGYYIGRSGGMTLQAPITFNGHSAPRPMTPSISEDEQHALERYRAKRAQKSNDVGTQTAREFDS